MKIIVALKLINAQCKCAQESEYPSDFEYANVLNIAGFWIYQGCEYAGVLNM